MATDDKAAPPEIFPSLRGREPTGDCSQPEQQQCVPLVDELVALLKRRGFNFGPPTSTALTEEVHAALEREQRELKSALHAANVATCALHAANSTLRHDAENAARARAAERQDFEAQDGVADELTLLRRAKGVLEDEVKQLGQQVEKEAAFSRGVLAQLHQADQRYAEVRAEAAFDAAAVDRARADERQGFEAQIEQLQRRNADSESNAEELRRVTEQIQRQREMITALQDERASTLRKFGCVEAENCKKQEQIQNQVTAIQALMHEKAELARELARELDSERVAPDGSVAVALAYLARPGVWVGLLGSVTQGKHRYVSNAFDRAVEAHMWFIKATTKEEG